MFLTSDVMVLVFVPVLVTVFTGLKIVLVVFALVLVTTLTGQQYLADEPLEVLPIVALIGHAGQR
jgi:hypothetical protein